MMRADLGWLTRSLLAFGLALVAMAPQAHADGWADKMFEVKSHDFRIVGRGTKAVYHFDFTNIYNEEVHVASVESSCGCTSPSVTKKTLKTHETASVVAKFNTSSFIGQKSAVVKVVFDRPRYAEVQLRVSGFIRTDITFDPPEVDFGDFTIGTPRDQEVTITHSGRTNWQITDVRSHCKHLQVRLSDPERLSNQVRYKMKVSLDGTMPVGDIREQLTLISNDRQFPTTEMLIGGRVTSAVQVSPASVNLGTLSPTSQKEQRLVITGKKPFEILDVQCEDRRFEFEVPAGKSKVQFVILRFKGDGTDRPVSQKIKVVTDLDGNESAQCTVTGKTSG